jgi:DnaK suppressor protein
MSALDLESLRTRLNERREVVLERLRSANDSLDELDRSQPAEAEEEAQELNIARPQVTLDQRSRNELAEIDDALERIARGEYGICETCGEPIGQERLLALPSAVQCVECAEQAERRAQGGTAKPEPPLDGGGSEPEGGADT